MGEMDTVSSGSVACAPSSSKRRQDSTQSRRKNIAVARYNNNTARHRTQMPGGSRLACTSIAQRNPHPHARLTGDQRRTAQPCLFPGSRRGHRRRLPCTAAAQVPARPSITEAAHSYTPPAVASRRAPEQLPPPAPRPHIPCISVWAVPHAPSPPPGTALPASTHTAAENTERGEALRGRARPVTLWCGGVRCVGTQTGPQGVVHRRYFFTVVVWWRRASLGTVRVLLCARCLVLRFVSCVWCPRKAVA